MMCVSLTHCLLPQTSTQVILAHAITVTVVITGRPDVHIIYTEGVGHTPRLPPAEYCGAEKYNNILSKHKLSILK